MEILFETLVAILSAFGLFSLFWCFLGRAMLPIRHEGHVLVVLPVSGSKPYLQKTVRELEMLKLGFSGDVTIVILDEGMDEQSAKNAWDLAADKKVKMCAPGQLDEIVKRVDGV